MGYKKRISQWNKKSAKMIREGARSKSSEPTRLYQRRRQ